MTDIDHDRCMSNQERWPTVWAYVLIESFGTSSKLYYLLTIWYLKLWQIKKTNYGLKYPKLENLQWLLDSRTRWAHVNLLYLLKQKIYS